LPQAVEGEDITAEAQIGKVKWVAKQRIVFLNHVDDLRTNNTFIQNVAEMKALTAIHDLLAYQFSKERFQTMSWL